MKRKKSQIVLNPDEVMQAGDTIHWGDGAQMTKHVHALVAGMTVKEIKEEWAGIVKITRKV